MEPSPATNINYDALPNTFPPSARTESRILRLSGAAVCAFVALAATYHMRYNVPVAVLNVLVVCVTTIAALALTYLGLKKSRAELILQERAKYRDDLSNLTFPEMNERGLIANKVFTKEELNLLFDAELDDTVEIGSFMSRHTDQVIPYLNDTNCGTIKKYITEHLDAYTGVKTFTANPWVKGLTLDTDELCASLLVERTDQMEDDDEYTYDDFVDQHGITSLKYFSPTPALRDKFKPFLLEEIKDQPVSQVFQDYKYLFSKGWLSADDRPEENGPMLREQLVNTLPNETL